MESHCLKKPPSRRALKLIRHWEAEGYVLPILAKDAIKCRGVGPAILPELIELDVVLDPFSALSPRSKNALNEKELLSKEQVAAHAYFAGPKKDARGFRNIEYKDAIRNLGFKSYLEICGWLGIK
jgi:hypothetical protein